MARYGVRRKAITRRSYRTRTLGRARASRAKSYRRARAVVPGISRISGYYGGIENKFFDQDIDDAVVATGGTIQAAGSICNIAQGTTEIQRDGRKCVVNAINWRYSIKVPSNAAANGFDTVRVILYLDKQCNGATAAVGDILETDDYQSFNNLANRSRFRILLDRTHTLKQHGAAGNGTTNETLTSMDNFSFYKKCQIPLEFSSTTGAITELRSNNIGVMLVGHLGTAVFESKMRLRFTG